MNRLGLLTVAVAAVAAIVLPFLSFSPSLSGYLPTHQWEVKVALVLSGHARPYVRQDLHRPAAWMAGESLRFR